MKNKKLLIIEKIRPKIARLSLDDKSNYAQYEEDYKYITNVLRKLNPSISDIRYLLGDDTLDYNQVKKLLVENKKLYTTFEENAIDITLFVINYLLNEDEIVNDKDLIPFICELLDMEEDKYVYMYLSNEELNNSLDKIVNNSLECELEKIKVYNLILKEKNDHIIDYIQTTCGKTVYKEILEYRNWTKKDIYELLKNSLGTIRKNKIQEIVKLYTSNIEVNQDLISEIKEYFKENPLKGYDKFIKNYFSKCINPISGVYFKEKNSMINEDIFFTMINVGNEFNTYRELIDEPELSGIRKIWNDKIEKVKQKRLREIDAYKDLNEVKEEILSERERLAYVLKPSFKELDKVLKNSSNIDDVITNFSILEVMNDYYYFTLDHGKSIIKRKNIKNEKHDDEIILRSKQLLQYFKSSVDNSIEKKLKSAETLKELYKIYNSLSDKKGLIYLNEADVFIKYEDYKKVCDYNINGHELTYDKIFSIKDFYLYKRFNELVAQKGSQIFNELYKLDELDKIEKYIKDKLVDKDLFMYYLGLNCPNLKVDIKKFEKRFNVLLNEKNSRKGTRKEPLPLSEFKKKYSLFLDYLTNGVPTNSNTYETITLLDYCMLFNALPLNEFRKIIVDNELPGLNKILEKFLLSNEKLSTKKVVPFNVNGYDVTIEDINAVERYLKDNNIPLYQKNVITALRRALKGMIKIPGINAIVVK